MSAPNAGSPAPLPEPKTPMWLPAIGAVLFLMGGLYWATSPEPVPITSEVDAGSSADAAVPAVAEAAAPIARAAITATAVAPTPSASAVPSPSAARGVGDAGTPRRPPKK